MNPRYVLLLLLIQALAFSAYAQRLPDTTAPDSYQIAFNPNFDHDNFTGDETIEIRVLKPTSTVVLNALDIDFQDVTISKAGVAQNAVVKVDRENQTASLAVTRQLSPGIATIHIRYTGVLNNQLRGFYLSRTNGRKYAVTQFEATDARRAFPSYDEPAYKAKFDISATVNTGDTAISNAKIVSDTPGPDARKHTIKFATTPKMSSYLVALAVGDFEYIEGSADGIPIRVWATPGKKELGRFALQTAERCMTYFDRYFGIKYPFEKLDLIAIPDFAAGAMENTGAITFRDAELLLDEKQASTASFKEIGAVVSHEMAHQWFGDLVTMQWWDDIWLNEGFATWMENKPLETWKPEWHLELDDALDSGAALNTDSLRNTRPIHQTVETPAQIEEVFDGIAYGKAAAVLRMLESYLGPETFRAGVNEYLKAHAYGNATQSDFWSALASVSGKPVDRIMRTFVNQPGAPLLSIQTQCEGNTTKVTLSQRRYYYDRSLLESDKQTWLVPVCEKTETGAEKTQCVLLDSKKRTTDLPGCHRWVFTNAGANGYYRVGYASDAFHVMTRDVQKDFSAAERIVLVRDAWAAVRAGQQPIGDFLHLAESLQVERDRAVAQQLGDEVEYIGTYLVSEPDRASYQAWIRGLLSPVAKELGWQPAPNENDNRKELRAFVLYTLGHAGRDPETLAAGRKLAMKALRSPGSVDPSLLDSAFGLAALNGDAAFYDQILAQLKANDSPEQYYRYFYTLAQFSDPKLLQRTLDYALTPAVRSQDTLGLIASVMGNPAGDKLAWDFVRAHWSEIEKIVGGFNTGGLVSSTGSFCDAGLRDQVKQFFAQHPVPAAERSLRQAQERVNYCLDLRTQASAALSAWLERYGSSSGK
jgi:aminopeptidase N